MADEPEHAEVEERDEGTIPPIAEDPEFGDAWRRLQAKKLEGDEQVGADHSPEVLSIGADGVLRSEKHRAASAKVTAEAHRSGVGPIQPAESVVVREAEDHQSTDIEETGEVLIALPSADPTMATMKVGREITAEVDDGDDDLGRRDRSSRRAVWIVLLVATALLSVVLVFAMRDSIPETTTPASSGVGAVSLPPPTGTVVPSVDKSTFPAISASQVPDPPNPEPSNRVRPTPPRPPTTASASVKPPPTPPTPPTPIPPEPSSKPEPSGFVPIHPVPN